MRLRPRTSVRAVVRAGVRRVEVGTACARARGPCEVGDAEVGVDAEDFVEMADRCLVVPHLQCGV